MGSLCHAIDNRPRDVTKVYLIVFFTGTLWTGDEQGLENKELNCALRYIPSNLRCIPDRVCVNVKYPDLDNGSPIESILGFYSNLIPDRIRIESDHDIRYNLSANDVDQK